MGREKRNRKEKEGKKGREKEWREKRGKKEGKEKGNRKGRKKEEKREKASVYSAVHFHYNITRKLKNITDLYERFCFIQIWTFPVVLNFC